MIQKFLHLVIVVLVITSAATIPAVAGASSNPDCPSLQIEESHRSNSNPLTTGTNGSLGQPRPMPLDPLWPSDPSSWEIKETQKFRLIYKPGYESDADRILDAARDAYRTLETELGYSANEQNDIKLNLWIKTEKTWHRPQWNWKTGTSTLSDNGDVTTNVTIELLAPSDISVTGSRNSKSDGVAAIMTHEMTHHFIVQKKIAAPGAGQYEAPEWLAEGFAEYMATYHTTDSVEERELETREDVRTQITNGNGNLAYLISEPYAAGPYLVQFSIEEYGMDTVVELQTGSGDQNFATVFQNVTGDSIETFERKWLLWAEENIGGEYPVSEEGIREQEQWEDQIQRKDRQIEQYKARLQSKNQTIQTKNEIIQSKNQTITNLRGKLDDRDVTKQQRKQTIREKNNEIQDLQRRLDQKNKKVQECGDLKQQFPFSEIPIPGHLLEEALLAGFLVMTVLVVFLDLQKHFRNRRSKK